MGKIMKKIAALVIFSLIPYCVCAEPISGHESNATTEPGSQKQVTTTTSGTKTALDVNISSGLSLDSEHAEDAAFADGATGQVILGVNSNSLGGAFNSTSGDATPLAVSNKGVLFTAIQSNGQADAAQGILKAEDSAHSSGDAGVGILTKRTDSPASSAGTDADYATLNTDSDGALWVDNIGQTVSIDVALATDTAAYAAGDYINDADDITDLTAALRTNVNSGTITNVVVTDEGGEGKNLELWIFDTDPTNSTFTDNAAFTVADADLVNVACVIPITTHHAAAASGVSVAHDVGCSVQSAGTTLYGALVAREAVTFDAADAVTLRVVVAQD